MVRITVAYQQAFLIPTSGLFPSQITFVKVYIMYLYNTLNKVQRNAIGDRRQRDFRDGATILENQVLYTGSLTK